MGVEGRAAGASHSARRSREARPSSTRRRDGLAFVPQRTGWWSRRVAPQGCHRAQADGGLQPRAPPKRRVPVRVLAAPRQRAPVRDFRPPRLLQRRHVSADGDGQRHVLPQADELPDALSHLPRPPAQLPRVATAAVRTRHGVPLRARRHAARPLAHPRLHARRLAHLLHARAPCRRNFVAARLRAVGAATIRVRRLLLQIVDAQQRKVGRQRRDLGQSHRGAASGTRAARRAVHHRRRRCRLLRPEDRRRRARRDRPQVAALHDPGRLPVARAFRFGVRGRRQPAPPADHAAPRALRFSRAILRRAARALRRIIPHVARAGAGAHLARDERARIARGVTRGEVGGRRLPRRLRRRRRATRQAHPCGETRAHSVRARGR